MGHTPLYWAQYQVTFPLPCGGQTDRQTDRQTRQTGHQNDRQIDQRQRQRQRQGWCESDLTSSLSLSYRR
eukprot:566908-Rhodomonas_salina.2